MKSPVLEIAPLEREEIWSRPTNGEPSLLEFSDLVRLSAGGRLEPNRQVELGQFFTEARIAGFMASLFDATGPSLHLLDAGAGIGSLSAAFVSEVCQRKEPPHSLKVTAYEVDHNLIPHLKDTLEKCRTECARRSIEFEPQIINGDFVYAGVQWDRTFDCAILNPPYRKIGRNSEWRRSLSTIGIETGNLYSTFLWLAMRFLKSQGEIVAITPRSFCNGPYFKSFRSAFNSEMDFRRFHLFESRQEAFKDDGVLQENIIFHAVKTKSENDGTPVYISTGNDLSAESLQIRTVPHSQVIRPTDTEAFINLVPDEWGRRVAEQAQTFEATLSDLGINVSTGRVVDFRATSHLRMRPDDQPGENVAPLIYPLHFGAGFVEWPKVGAKKPNGIAINEQSGSLLNDAGFYVLVKRFSSKEQKRRIVAVVYDPEQARWDGRASLKVGFENHLNYFHENGLPLSKQLAVGLATFLNSTLIDSYFRQFNGHTQVNATDLRSLKYPSRLTLETLGQRVLETYGDGWPSQEVVDTLITLEFSFMSDENTFDPILSKARIEEALSILKALKLDRQQQNERSALTLLALLNLTPSKSWGNAEKPLIGITPMMEFFREHYGKDYAPNSRETVRRQSVHQFMMAGLIVANPDDPKRPINSGKNVYQITPEALELLRDFGTPQWESSLEKFQALQAAINARALKERALHRIPVTTTSGEALTLSPGGQNVLIKEVLEQFCPRYTPGGKLLYVGDADEKWAFYDAEYLAALGVKVDAHGKMPDVVVHHVENNWLLLIEAVTTHGPVDLKRHIELKELFAGSTSGLVFVTTFLDRATLGKYLRDIAWETEVWVADAPDHLIHFNGERFLGPYPS